MLSNTVEKTNPNRTLELQSQAGRLRALKNRASSAGLNMAVKRLPQIQRAVSTATKTGAALGSMATGSSAGVGLSDAGMQAEKVEANSAYYLKQAADYARNPFGYAQNYLQNESGKRKAVEEPSQNAESYDEGPDIYEQRLDNLKRMAIEKAEAEKEEDQEQEDGGEKEADESNPMANMAKEMANKGLDIVTATAIKSAWAAFIETFGLSIFILDAILIFDIVRGRFAKRLANNLAVMVVSLLYFGLIACLLALLMIIIYAIFNPLDALKILGLSGIKDMLSLFIGISF